MYKIKYMYITFTRCVIESDFRKFTEGARVPVPSLNVSFPRTVIRQCV